MRFLQGRKFEIGADKLRESANLDSKAALLNPGMPIAIVGATDLIFGLARMWEVYVDGARFETAVFRELEEAEAWLKSQLG